MVDVANLCFVVVMGIALITQVLIPAIQGPISRLDPDLGDWLRDNSLELHAGHFVDTGKIFKI